MSEQPSRQVSPLPVTLSPKRPRKRLPPVIKRPGVSVVPSTSTSTSTSSTSTRTGASLATTSPPSVLVPAPPLGFVPAPSEDLRGYRPTQAEVAAVADVVLELDGLPSWNALFGVTASDPTSLFRDASAWTALLVRSDAWLSYVKAQHGLAWKAALAAQAAVKGPYRAAVIARPDLVQAYPALARLMGADRVIARRGRASRARAAKAAAAVAAGTPANAPAVSEGSAGE